MGADASELRALAADLRRQMAAVPAKVDATTQAFGDRAVGIVQSNAPVDTGFHKSSIGMDILGLAHVEVGASSEYAPYLEYGTYKMAARPHIIPGVESVVPAWVAALEALGGDI